MADRGTGEPGIGELDSNDVVTCPICGHAFHLVPVEGHGWRGPSSHLTPAVFRREGEYWFIAYQGEAFRLRHTNGLDYLARLIANPGREILAFHLAQARPDPSRHRNWRLRSDEGLRVFTAGDSWEVVDDRARAAYEQRIRDLQEDLEEAEAIGDMERTAHIREELEALTEHLSVAIGLGGKARRTTSPAERARQSVTKAIKSAADRIAQSSPALARHFASTVRTGTYCIYDPDPRIPITWQT